jgi:hypothetical protein
LNGCARRQAAPLGATVYTGRLPASLLSLILTFFAQTAAPRPAASTAGNPAATISMSFRDGGIDDVPSGSVVIKSVTVK